MKAKRPATPPRPEKFPVAKQRRMDELLEKNAAGVISARELATLERLVNEAEALIAANAKRLAEFSALHPSNLPAPTPVTVWVAPSPAEK